MCADPVTLTLMAISAATTISQHNAQMEGAKNQQDALDLNNRVTHMDLQRQAGQQAEQAAGENNAYAAAARRDMATLETFNGEYGGGNTGSRAMSVMGVQQGQDFATIGSNAMKKQGEISLSSTASNLSTSQGMAAINKPTIAGSLLTIAGQTAGQYAGYKARQPVLPKG